LRPFGVVVLAAGGSSRLGRPKQLLPYLGRTLIEHAVRTALASGAGEVVVVLGAEAERVRERLKGLPVRIVLNRDWEAGMGGSLALGIAALSQTIESAVVALADQPRITPQHLRTLAEKARPIAASSYDGVVGAPCAFTAEVFDRLKRLNGDAGARDIIRGNPDGVTVVEFAGANIDVDTPEDIRWLVPEPSDADPDDVQIKPKDARGPPVAASIPH